MLYDFVCDKCKIITEVSCGMNDIQNLIPPECNGCQQPMRREFNIIDIDFKCGGGTGAYGQCGKQ